MTRKASTSHSSDSRKPGAGATVATLIAVSPQFTQESDRRDLASDMQKQFRKQGLQYSVTLAEGRDTVLRVEYPGLGALPLLAPPIRLTGEGNPRRGRPPRLGEHTEEVLSEWIGLGTSDLQALREEGAF